VSGTVTRVNGALEDKPELVNEDCWGAGWMIAIQGSAASAGLLDASGYTKLLEESDH
jgi:glycine cleavage system H protein